MEPQLWPQSHAYWDAAGSRPISCCWGEPWWAGGTAYVWCPQRGTAVHSSQLSASRLCFTQTRPCFHLHHFFLCVFPLVFSWQKTAHKYRGEDGESSNTVRFGDTYKCISAQEQLYYIHCRVVRFSIWKIETQPTNLYNKHQSVQSSQDSTPRNQTDSIQYAMALFFPQKNYRAMNSTYTIYAGECPGRPQSTVHRSNLICPEVQPLTRWNIATIQNENITQVLVRFSFTGRNTFVGRVHRFVQMGIELGDRHQHLTIMMNAAIVLVTGVNRLHYKCQSNSQECGSSTFWQHWFHIWSNGDQWVSGFKAADSLKPPSSWSVSNQTG